MLTGILRDLRAVLPSFVNNRIVNKTGYIGEGIAPDSRPGTRENPGRRGRHGQPKQWERKGHHLQNVPDWKHGQSWQNENLASHGQRESREHRERRRQRERQLHRVRMAREGLTAVSLWRWLGRTVTATDRVLCHRELLRLETLGLLIRQAGRSGRRTTYVKLTESGEAIARQLLAQENDTADEPFAVEDLPLLPLDWPPGCLPNFQTQATAHREADAPPSSPAVPQAAGEAVSDDVAPQ